MKNINGHKYMVSHLKYSKPVFYYFRKKRKARKAFNTFKKIHKGTVWYKILNEQFYSG